MLTIRCVAESGGVKKKSPTTDKAHDPRALFDTPAATNFVEVVCLAPDERPRAASARQAGIAESTAQA